MQKARSNSNAGGFQDLRGVEVLWHGWLKKLGRFSKRWQRRYFVFLSTPSGMKELRHYDALKDVQTLLQSTPKGVISMTDVSGVCYFTRPPPSSKKPTKFARTESNESKPTAYDQKFAIFTPLHVHFLAFYNGKEWSSASESQQGLSLLASLSAFYPAVDVLHSGWMSKRRERTVHSPKGIMSYWKRHYFVFLNSGDLIYFRDETLNELQGRVDVRHAPTVRVTGEHLMEEKKKDGIFKFSKLQSLEREDCLVWIATPPSKMFVLKVQEDHDNVASGLSSSIGPGIAGAVNARKAELSPSARKWLELLLKGHAQTKYTQLEKCVDSGTFDLTPEIVSAVRAGIPDELRGQLWRGFSGALELQRRAELKRAIRKVSKPTSTRGRGMPTTHFATDYSAGAGSPRLANLYNEYSAPIDIAKAKTPENQMLFARLCALSLQDSGHVAVSMRPSDLHESGTRMNRAISDLSSPSERGDRNSLFHEDYGAMNRVGNDLELENALAEESKFEDKADARNSLKQLEKGKLGNYMYPSDYPAAGWEQAARRRLLMATSRFNPFSHPCPWRVSCLLLAYVEEESAFWIVNSIIDAFMPGYFHGYRPALQVDAMGFCALLQQRSPALYSHLRSLEFPLDRLVERWFLSLFTASAIPLPTVLRVWDAFFVQGIRIFYGIGLALLFRAEETLFHAKSAIEAEEFLRVTERSSIDADEVFAHVFKDDLNISWLTDEQLERWRGTYRQHLVTSVTHKTELLSEKISHLGQLRELCIRCAAAAKQYVGAGQSGSIPFSQDMSAVLDDADDADASLVLKDTMKTVISYIRVLSDAIAALSSDYSLKRSKWLAISSQLSACPLARLPNPDSYSWLTQVREGKISGAGHDSSYSANDWGGFLSAEQIIDLSDMVFDTGDMALQGNDVLNGSTYLVMARDDLKLTESHLSGLLIHALASTVKALSALRLELAATTYRVRLLCGHWIESPIEYPSVNARRRGSTTIPVPGVPNSRRSTRVKQPAAETGGAAAIKRRLRPQDDSALVERRSDADFDSTISRRINRRSFYKPSHRMRTSTSMGLLSGAVPEEEVMDDSDDLYSTLNDGEIDEDVTGREILVQIAQDNAFGHWQGETAASGPTTSRSPLANELIKYQTGERALADLHARFVVNFSRFIRLESRPRGWDLRDQAYAVEQDLQRELQEVEAEALGLQW